MRRRSLPDESHYQQLQAARARVRSACEFRLLRPESLCRDSDSHLLTQPESKAHRVPHARRRCKSISRLLGVLLAGLDGIQNRLIRRSAGQKSLRTSARRTRQGRQRSRFAPRRNRSAGGRPFLPAARRRLQRKLHRQLDRHETKGIRRATSPTPSVRVRDVLRCVIMLRDCQTLDNE